MYAHCGSTFPVPGGVGEGAGVGVGIGSGVGDGGGVAVGVAAGVGECVGEGDGDGDGTSGDAVGIAGTTGVGGPAGVKSSGRRANSAYVMNTPVITAIATIVATIRDTGIAV
jgi:hypothetical protein